MAENILKVNNVSKSYKSVLALDKVSIEIEKGRIYGFIGQNGAGKTTLMSIITGLSYPTEGTIEIFGSKEEKELEKSRKKMGTMIEKVSMYPNLTVKQNLEFYKVLKGITDENAVENTLRMVELIKMGNKKFKNLSLGMKQRLGIAAALIGNPEILILDEPVNGLDPIGILEVREILLNLNKEYGTTILISSHILSELYMLATDYIIIHEGKIVDSLTLEQLSNKCKKNITIQSEGVDDVKDILEKQLNISDYIVLEDNKVRLFDDSYSRRDFARTFYDNEIVLTELSYSDESLESYFINAIGGMKNEEIA